MKHAGIPQIIALRADTFPWDLSDHPLMQSLGKYSNFQNFWIKKSSSSAETAKSNSTWRASNLAVLLDLSASMAEATHIWILWGLSSTCQVSNYRWWKAKILCSTLEKLATTCKLVRGTTYGTEIISIYSGVCFPDKRKCELPLVTVYAMLYFSYFVTVSDL